MNELTAIFTTKKIIDFKILNFLGLQGLRYLLAKFSYQISSLFFLRKKEIIDEYDNKGAILKENFLEKKFFKAVQQEFEKIIKTNAARNVYESNTNEANANRSINYFLYEFEDDKKNKEQFPNLYKLSQLRQIREYFENAERKKNCKIFMRLERVETKDEKKNDINSYWHVDTYHNTHKAWIYLTDIENKNGPFNYIESSNRLSISRLIWEYYNSVVGIFKKNYRPFFLDKKFSLIKEKKLIVMTCPKNSFMFANTHGFHRRGYARPGYLRDGISFYTRENPYKII